MNFFRKLGYLFAILYNIMNWEDSKDMTTIQGKDNISDEIFSKKDLKGKKIWVPKEYFEDGLDAWVKKEIENAIKKWKNYEQK